MTGADDDVTEAQLAESKSRLEAVRAGDMELLDDDDALRMISG